MIFSKEEIGISAVWLSAFFFLCMAISPLTKNIKAELMFDYMFPRAMYEAVQEAECEPNNKVAGMVLTIPTKLYKCKGRTERGTFYFLASGQNVRNVHQTIYRFFNYKQDITLLSYDIANEQVHIEFLKLTQ
ncbi:hypothetical protein [Aliivibrio fischeri]|uniref:hypothetical protein n=1 Tax=Aliivibrio fischeri TaxID=668 RepID=UPI0007C46221|nr:hypothetical protein [Aliivibrio fischeri]